MIDRIARAYRGAGYRYKVGPVLPTAYVGVDLGQARDYTTTAVLSVLPSEHGKEIPLRKRQMECRRLERIPLRTPYPEIVRYVAKLCRHLQSIMGKVYLLLDATGVGRPVVNMFEAAGLDPIGITVTSGHDVTRGEQPNSVNVPKRDLISSLQVAMHLGNMHVARNLKFAETFKRELDMFKVKITTKGSLRLEAWRESDHDDLVFAMAMACWAATYEDFDRYTPAGGATMSSIWVPR